jgi:pimeloyl-ACP methyl ester carboxylesterase
MKRAPWPVLFGLVGVAALCACTNSSEQTTDRAALADPDVPGQMVDLGTHRMHLYCRGEGSPTVVLDVGFGESYESWEHIVSELTARTEVCVYDRAGYGDSEPGPLPRNARLAARELYALLEVSKVEPPYLLVGHSYGALPALLMAAAVPGDVAGVVVLDPPPRGFLSGERFVSLKEMALAQTSELQQAAEQAKAEGDMDRADYFETLASEHGNMFLETAEQMERVSDLGDLPLIVIGSRVANPAFGDSADSYQEFWIESNRELASLSRRGEFILAGESTHHIHLDAPDLVIGAIEKLLSGE